MTENTADAIRAALIANGHALAVAREDAAKYDRLRKAEAEVKRLQKEGDELTAKLSKALSDDDDARVRAVAKQFRNFRVSLVVGERSLTTAKVVISYDRLRYNIDTRENEWTPEVVDGFHFLDTIVLRYMIAHKPDVIPGPIMALAPNDAWAAVTRFMVARERNFA